MRIQAFRNWFDQYVAGFTAGEDTAPDLVTNIHLKKDHSERVVKEMAWMAAQLDLDNKARDLAAVMALFHDIGRFEQYARYRTFVDHRSANHAELGVKVLRQHRVLDGLPPDQADLICRVISYHNRAALPDDDTEECLFYARMLRDADKLDIWRVLIDHYQRQDRDNNPAVELGLPDTPDISDRVFAHVVNAQIVEARHIRNLNDFKLLQIGWVFDINFLPALQQVKDRGYIEAICRTLPPSDHVTRIEQAVATWFHRKLPAISANHTRAGT
ncbi:MAG: HD domain-containing protein [Desulfotignum sp.]|nr:HD domain-containing protein [Desulfotignum sp.]MCF8089887.1 HD domain-containing protein [Desulfotignum sp.]MCF8137549.1 HD domain-containing protein [Desulfotignum sp.]